MKKFFMLSSVVLWCAAVSGCVDIYQHLTKDGDGLVRNTIKVTVSKAVFEMAGSFSEERINYDELFSDGNVDINAYDRFKATSRKINDALDVGYLLDMKVDYRDKAIADGIAKDAVSFMPQFKGKNIVIHVDCLGDGDMSSDDNMMAAAFLATGKYRIAVNKKMIAGIDKASVKTSDGEQSLSVYDMLDEYLVEIPVPLIFMSAVDVILYGKCTAAQSFWTLFGFS
jgi:hypothetical protein